MHVARKLAGGSQRAFSWCWCHVVTCVALSLFAAEGAPGEGGVREGAFSAHCAQRGPVRADHGDGLEEPSSGLHPHEQGLVPLPLHLHHPYGNLHRR